MSFSAKINKIGFPNLNQLDDESRSLHRNLINKNWKFNKLPTSNVLCKQRAGGTKQVSRNFAWDSSSVAHLLKRTTIGTSIDEINFFLNQGLEESINQLLTDKELR